MKKLLAAITLLLYVAVSTGFVISVHYCMDRVRSLQLGDVAQHHCSKCGMPISKSGGCCKDEVKVVKLQVDQIQSHLVNADFSPPQALTAAFESLHSPAIAAQMKTETVAHSPPVSEQNIYLKNCVFRI